MKKKIVLGLMGIGLCVLPNSVLAASANVGINGNNNVIVGETFKVDISINNVKDTVDGVESFSGQVNYDKNNLEYIGVETNNSNYEFLINEDNLKLAALDYTMANGIKNDTVVYTFTFKAKSAGNTNITIDNLKLTDSKRYLDTSLNELTVNIVNKSTTTAKSNLTEAIKTSKSSSLTTSKRTTSVRTTTTSTTTTTKVIEAKKEEKKEKNTFLKTIKNAICEFINKIKGIFKA